MDSMFPLAYPLNSSEKPILKILDLKPISRAFPGQLYVFAGFQNKMLRIFVFWDSNVYDDVLVTEWANEIGSFTREYMVAPSEGVLARL